MWRDLRFQLAILTFVTTGAGAITTVATQATDSTEGKFTFWLLASFMLLSFVYLLAPFWSSPVRDVRVHVRRQYRRRRDKKDFLRFRPLWLDFDAFLRFAIDDYLNPPWKSGPQLNYSKLRKKLQTFRAPMLDELHRAVRRSVYPEIGGVDFWAQHLVRAIQNADSPFAVFYTDPDLGEQWRRLFDRREHWTQKAILSVLDRIRDAMLEFAADLGVPADE